MQGHKVQCEKTDGSLDIAWPVKLLTPAIQHLERLGVLLLSQIHPYPHENGSFVVAVPCFWGEHRLLSPATCRDQIARYQPVLYARRSHRESSGGNPFFALELIRGVAELGISGEAASLASLPDTVHAAVLARIDLLTPHEREILQVASVASRAFSAGLLHALVAGRSGSYAEANSNFLLALELAPPSQHALRSL